MAIRTTKHKYYLEREHFEKLVQDLVVAMLRHYAEKGIGHLPPGQYLVLHEVSGGDAHIPVLFHVKQGYEGLEVYVHPVPLDKKVADALKRMGVHTPYGPNALDYLFFVLREGKHRDVVWGADYILKRLGTERSKITYPPLPEYASGYEANKLLQQTKPDGEYVLDRSKVFVGEYHKNTGWKLDQFDPKKHDIFQLKTIWTERSRDFPIAHVSHERYQELRHRALHGRGIQTHYNVV